MPQKKKTAQSPMEDTFLAGAEHFVTKVRRAGGGGADGGDPTPG